MATAFTTTRDWDNIQQTNNTQEATNGAIDFVDFLLEGPEAMKGRRGTRRSKPWEE